MAETCTRETLSTAKTRPHRTIIRCVLCACVASRSDSNGWRHRSQFDCHKDVSERAQALLLCGWLIQWARSARRVLVVRLSSFECICWIGDIACLVHYNWCALAARMQCMVCLIGATARALPCTYTLSRTQSVNCTSLAVSPIYLPLERARARRMAAIIAMCVRN